VPTHWLERRRELTDPERERARRRAYSAEYRQAAKYKAAKLRCRQRHREQLNGNTRHWRERHRGRFGR
jgi:hypothetical protein